ncbi:hypothetical protein BU23DRAFT_190346 [Bimuria novae-zelandiae CBS 107.79]|uniref:Fork-head domain-containing protein n=1 Tax=Bimuria novae-zelandiae CBS 107.79 TaxID=1447943 RepID=A0A6A5VQQ4_9PLEO|nr:hypothetical protein BU23DRAFT_190346 [Bimuria novae-zelandiae CBS 107.79]
MEDSKAMPRPPSPRSPSHADLSEDLGTLPPSQDDFGAPIPLYTPTPLLSSPRPSVSSSTMATALQDITPSTLKGLPPAAYDDLDDPDTMQWGTHHNPLMSSIAQNDTGFNVPMQFNSGTAIPYSYDRTAFNDNYNLAYQPPPPSSCPRSLNNGYGLNGMSTNGMNMSSFPPPMYQMRPQQPYEGMDLSLSPNNNLMQLESEYDEYPLRSIPEDSTAYSTPYDSDVSRASTPASPRTLQEEEPIDGDQPYAQLIYKALLQAPDNTMILRDIYDWFRSNTGKAADKDTKGWQNSIRHNLSMNGAFEKVDQPSEEARKGFMWRLTEEAKQHGVKSTTRYRSKQPNKRGHRSGLYPQKQRAGAIGGRNAKKQLRHRRMNDAYRSEPYQTRSIPTPTTFGSAFNSDMSMYSHNPYYSPTGSEVDHMEYPTDSFGNPVEVRRPGMMHEGFAHGYPTHGLPMSSSPVGGYDAYIQLPSDPSDPLFSNSPSPSASEPRTPDSETAGWSDNVFGSMGGAGHLGYDPYVPLGDSTIAHEPLAENE